MRVHVEVRHGSTVTEIIDCTKIVDADLIAMTTHGRGGLRYMLFGSIAEGVLRHAEVPVFLMRLTEQQLRSREAHEALR